MKSEIAVFVATKKSSWVFSTHFHVIFMKKRFVVHVDSLVCYHSWSLFHKVSSYLYLFESIDFNSGTMTDRWRSMSGRYQVDGGSMSGRWEVDDSSVRSMSGRWKFIDPRSLWLGLKGNCRLFQHNTKLVADFFKALQNLVKNFFSLGSCSYKTCTWYS